MNLVQSTCVSNDCCRAHFCIEGILFSSLLDRPRRKRLQELEHSKTETDRAQKSGEVQRIKAALQARLRMQAAHLHELQNENELLEEELKDAKKRRVAHRVSERDHFAL